MICLLGNDFVREFIAELLELLKVVVIVEPHATLFCYLANLIEQLASLQDVIPIPIWIKLDVISNLLIPKCHLIVESTRNDVDIEWIDVTSNNGKS